MIHLMKLIFCKKNYEKCDLLVSAPCGIHSENRLPFWQDIPICNNWYQHCSFLNELCYGMDTIYFFIPKCVKYILNAYIMFYFER